MNRSRSRSRSFSGSKQTTPASFPGLVLWLEVDVLGMGEEVGVTSITDKSPNRITLVQPNSANQPKYHTGSLSMGFSARPYMGFTTSMVMTGSQPSLAVDSDASAGFTSVCVFAGSVDVVDQMLWMTGEFSNGKRRASWISAAGTFNFSGFSAASNLTSSFSALDGNTHILSTTKNSSNVVSLFADGAPLTSAQVTLVPYSFQLFGWGANYDASEACQNRMSGMALYNRPLPPSQRLAVERYFGKKYGVSI